MFRLHSEITINQTVFKAVIGIELETSWENLTDTCRIEVPNTFKRDGKNITVGDEGFFKRGDAVTVKLGYFPNLKVEFEGYIRKIFVDNVVVIECEDSAWLLKQNTIIKGFPKVTIDELLKVVLNQPVFTTIESETIDGKEVPLVVQKTDKQVVEHTAVDANLGQFTIDRVTAAGVLDKLKNPYGLVSYFRNRILRVGLAYYLDEGVTETFDFEQNIIENNLEYVDARELIITVNGISIQNNNTVLERFAYYKDGVITVSSTNPNQGEIEEMEIPNQTQKDLDFYITNKLEQRLSTGTRGSFTTFLEPSVTHGDKCILKSRKFPERNGTFLIKKVVKTFGMDGGRQIITLDTQIA